jgi:DNA-directed RNA polymerase sigma subunit (sigma70/sigma32)
LSRKFDYTEERIRQIKFEALEKMKKLGWKNLNNDARMK